MIDGTLRERFQAEGYLVLPELASAEELEVLRPAADHLLAGRISAAAARRGGDRSFMTSGETLWIRLSELEASLLAAIPAIQRARSLAASLLDEPEDTLDVGLRLFVKPPRTGLAMPFHQDEAHKDPNVDHRALNVWIALDDATPDSGCLRYEPGSHRGEVRPHYAPSGLGGHVSLITDVFDESAIVDAVVPAGGACIHHCRTLHGSHRNRVDVPRRALVAVIAAPAKARDTPHDWPWLEGQAPRYPDTSFG